MSVQDASSNRTSPKRWRLWVDGCGGYLLQPGDRWTVGSICQHSPADICVHADWPRQAGVILREDADYFWQAAQANAKSQLMTSGQTFPISGSAQMTLNCPNPLSGSATLQLQNPHRFDGHVDGAVLVSDTVVIGPGSDCHIQTHEFPDQAVLVLRDGQWQGKLFDQNTFVPLPPGQRTSLATLAMTLEPA